MMTFVEQNISQNQWENALNKIFPNSCEVVVNSIQKYPLFKNPLLSVLRKRLDQTPLTERNASFFMNEAYWQIQAENYSQAAQCFENAIQIDPKDPKVYYDYGILLLDRPELRDPHLCEEMFKTFLILKPQNPNGLKRLSESQKRNRSLNP